MNTYDFTLRFALSEASLPMDDRLERLAEAGCDDALPGIGFPGSIALAFTRRASSARSAVTSALADVADAMPDATLIEAAPDLVGLTDVAEIMGFSRQNMRQLMLGGGPPAAHEGKPSLWHLSQVLAWLAEARGYGVDAGLLELAEVTMQLNLAVASGRADESLQQEIRALLG